MTPSDPIRIDLLTAGAQLGDRQAFEQLVRLFHARVHYYVRKLLIKKDLADDVMQEVWMTAYRELPRLRATQAFPVWIYRIAHTETLRVIQAESHYVELKNDAELEAADEAKEAEENFTEEDIRLLNLALERIARPLREAIVLRFMDALTYEDIATVTGQPLGTVRSRIHYAKRALRKEMETLRHERNE